ncbi:hypothetical protein HC725_05215 [Vibrio sp. S17_S38]|uniref:hypothetical protein n=1 Tax=Vibrio sp. S17_S38 TaxID=2720229 RepID=UPI001681AD89|nr:hypothetical protein [Vibrio sp. S17_S38]MBD1572678.1 hypothetical protein [Vibrio sp. S17_S38]
MEQDNNTNLEELVEQFIQLDINYQQQAVDLLKSLVKEQQADNIPILSDQEKLSLSKLFKL